MYAGPYLLGKSLGDGPNGRVKLAVNRETNTECAIKVLRITDLDQSPDAQHRHHREMEILRRSNHPHLLQVYDVIATNNHLFIVGEFARGGDISQLLQRHRLSLDAAFGYFYSVLMTLEFCHNRGIFHRSLKPENILLDEDGHIRISDFWMSTILRREKLYEAHCGSPHYASPEMLRGSQRGHPDGGKSDVWSAGVLLFVLCSGRLPFTDTSLPRVIEKVWSGQYTFPSHFTPDLQDFLSLMLTVDVNGRATIGELKRHPWWREMCKKLSFNEDNFDFHDY